MNKSQKGILIMICIFIMVIIVISLILLSNIRNDNKTEDYLNVNKDINTNYTNNLDNNIQNNIINSLENLENPIFTIVEDKNQNTEMSIIKNIDNRSIYFTLKNLTINYINYVGYNNKEILEDIISEEYIKKYNISDLTQIESTIPRAKSGQHYEVILTEVLTAQIQDTQYVYIINGKGRIVETNQTFDINIFVRLDEDNSLYAIYPYNYLVDNGYYNLKNGDTIYCSKEELKENQNNKFTYIVRNDFDMAKEYFNSYNEMLLYHVDDAYSKLDSEYRKNRFSNIENFRQYISDNKKLIQNMEIASYKTVHEEDYTDYICADKYNNIYIYRQEKGNMKYSVFLDNYTIMTKDDIKYYNNLDKFDKAKYNLSKFIHMVNTKDYNAIYSVLDTTFKDNNFNNINILKQYILKNMYDLNSIQIEDFDDNAYGYCTFEVTLSNSKDKSSTKKMFIIINQSEGTEFTMSFSFK